MEQVRETAFVEQPFSMWTPVAVVVLAQSWEVIGRWPVNGCHCFAIGVVGSGGKVYGSLGFNRNSRD